MHCVICKRGTVKSGTVQAELRIGTDHLMVPVETEVCDECGEAYYSTEAMRQLEQVRENFLSKPSLRPRLARCTRFPDSQASQLAGPPLCALS